MPRWRTAAFGKATRPRRSQGAEIREKGGFGQPPTPASTETATDSCGGRQDGQARSRSPRQEPLEEEIRFPLDAVCIVLPASTQPLTASRLVHSRIVESRQRATSPENAGKSNPKIRQKPKTRTKFDPVRTEYIFTICYRKKCTQIS